MARVTVEDCLARIPNQFELSLVAAKRARQLARGAEARLPWGSHKSTVLSLKEIAEGYVGTSVLRAQPASATQGNSVLLGEDNTNPGGATTVTYSSTTSGGPYTKLTATPVAATAYTDSSVQAGQTYYFVVTAVDSANIESAYSAQVVTTIP